MRKFPVLGIVLILWGGLILGVSFIATPAKFMVSNLPTPVALEVGKVTFHIFNKIEWGMGMLVILCTAFTKEEPHKWFLSSSLLFLLLLETFWLLPLLDARVGQVIIGKHTIPDVYHNFYIFIEILKIVGVLGRGVWLTYRK